MTSLRPLLPCEACGGLILPANLFPAHQPFPPGVQYVCDDCGRLYAWEGSPPRLTIIPNLVVLRPRDGFSTD